MKNKTFQSENLNRHVSYVYFSVYGRIILKIYLNGIVQMCGLDSSGSKKSPVADSYGRGSKRYDYTKQGI
jgi:hypothetical protein